MKIHSRQVHAPLCGIFGPHSVNVAHYASLIRVKSPTNCDAHLTESNFQTRSRTVQYKMSSAPTTNPNEPGYIGDFNGEPIVIPQISEILKTRLHYMGNNTVMALN